MVVTNNNTSFQLKGRRQHDHGDLTESRSSYRQSDPDDNFPIHYSSMHCKFPDQLQTPQQQQQRSSMYSSRSTSPREHQPQHSSTIGKTSATTMAVVTPSPPSKGYDAIAHIDDDNGAWRKHGKIFRANIVLADEGIQGNSFSLSDSCTIERYYRVADSKAENGIEGLTHAIHLCRCDIVVFRVLEQFLSSNISERNELIESYLVGNRLFKFLSVVLPTHNQYFSPDPKLISLRNRSESQLMELLDYMHEIELMIDEMEYNRYILNDLTPSELIVDERGENSTSITNSISSDDGDTNGEFLGGSKDSKRSDISGGRSSTIATSVATSETLNQQNPGASLHQDDGDVECSGQRVSSSSSSHQIFHGGNVKVAVQAIEASHQIQGNSTKTNCQSQRKMLNERVTAVVNASNKLDGCNNTIKSMQSISSSVAKSAASPILHRSTDESKMTRKLQTDAHKNTNKTDNQGPKPQLNQSGIPIKLIKQPCRQQQRHIYESVSKPFNSWDEDFSHFNAFSDINQDVDSAAFDSNISHIDLLLQDPFPFKRKSSDIIKPLPKIKEPPVSHSRSVWAQAQVNAARLISPLEGINITNPFETELSPALSDCSSDIFNSLEDSEPSLATTKIEERMERAAITPIKSRDKLRNSQVAFDLTDYEDLLLMEAPNRKLLHQFKGCVKFLLD